MFGLSEFVVLLLLAMAVFIFLRAQQHRLLAASSAFRHCKKQQLQFLDQSVYLKSQSIVRGRGSVLAWEKCYGFEFTVTGERRYGGTVRMLGGRVAEIDLEPHVIPEVPPE